MLSRLLVLIFLVGCGVNGSESSSTTSIAQDPETSKAPDQTTPVKTTAPPIEISEEELTAQRHALLVADAKSLPACSVEAEGWLVYVKADLTFRACVDGEWEAISILGKDGVPGKDGAPGREGTPGKDGTSAPFLSANEWLDPVTDLKWMVGGLSNTSPGWLCDAPYRIATSSEVSSAFRHGVFEVLGLSTGRGVFEKDWYIESATGNVKERVPDHVTPGEHDPWAVRPLSANTICVTP